MVINMYWGGQENGLLLLKLAKTGWTIKANDLELHSVVDTVSVPLRSLQICFPFLCVPPFIYYLVFLKYCTCPSSDGCSRATLHVLLVTQKHGNVVTLSSSCSIALSRDRLEPLEGESSAPLPLVSTRS